MSNLIKAPSHQIQFFADNEEPLNITPEQYAVIRTAANEDKFIEIDGQLYNFSAIKSVVKLPKVRPKEKSYETLGSNPIFREWCSQGNPGQWKDFVDRWES